MLFVFVINLDLSVLVLNIFPEILSNRSRIIVVTFKLYEHI